MDREEMERHLTGADRDSDPAGPGRDDTTMTALSGVSIELGKLSVLMQQMDSRLAEVVTRQDAQDGHSELVADLGRRVQSLSEAVAELAAGEQPEEVKPAQPWDWASMDTAQRDEALDLLVAWAHEELYYWWPWVQTKVPPCWYEHRVMQHAMGTVYVAYQQAYRDPHRRVHHEADFTRILSEQTEDIDTRAQEYHCRDGAHRTQDWVRDDAAALERARRWECLTEIVLLDRQAGEADAEEAARIAAEVAQLKAEHQVTDAEVAEHVAQRVHHLRRALSDTALGSYAQDRAIDELHQLNDRYHLGHDLRPLVLARALHLNKLYQGSTTSERDREAVHRILQTLVSKYGITSEELRAYAQRND